MFAEIASVLSTAALSLSPVLSPSAHKVEIGTALFCNTQQQMERYVAAFDGNDEAAINAVNAEVHDPNACGYRTIAYIRGSEIDYVDSLMGAGFTVHNPNAVHSCSCGHSFDTGDDAGGAQACGCGH